jgi:hypothetical protein
MGPWRAGLIDEATPVADGSSGGAADAHRRMRAVYSLLR